MRWLLASLFVSAIFQTAGCDSSSRPAEGTERGSCYPNLTCNAGLICLSGLCVRPGPGMGVDAGAPIGTGGSDGDAASGSTRSDASAGGNTGADGTGGAAGGTTTATGGTTKAPVPDAGPDARVGGNTGAGGTGAAGATSTGGSTSATGGTTKVPVPDAGPEVRPDSSSSTTDGPLEDSVYFSYGLAQGLFTGYGWVELGKADSLSSPMCGNGQPITHDKPCKGSTVWSKSDALCMTGSIPALPASPVQSDYDDNWGVKVGVNAAEPGDAIGDKLAGTTTVTFTLSGSPKTGLRAILHRKGDPMGTTYCVDSIKSGTAIRFSKFNTKCWGDPTTVFLTEDDVLLIDQVAIQVPSSSSAISVMDLCLDQLTFAK